MFIPVTYFNNLDEGSTFISASGGTISYDGIYKIHTFTTTGSNTFTIHSLANTASNNAFDIVVVGGGGGGCSSNVAGGGGGAGQAIYSQSLQFIATGNYTASVGAGGARNTTSIVNTSAVTSRRGSKGGVSFFSGSIFFIKALGGGPGCIIDQWPSSSAQATLEEIACGGGAGFGFTSSPFPGEFPFVSGSIGTLFNGGNYIASQKIFDPRRTSGGGGGASAFNSGSNGSWGLPVPGGPGADGVSTTINGFTKAYGGGGGGARNSAGGSGGGGNSNDRGGSNGVNGQGGGGGGSLEQFFGTPDAGNGGSGTVVIRYRYK